MPSTKRNGISVKLSIETNLFLVQTTQVDPMVKARCAEEVGSGILRVTSDDLYGVQVRVELTNRAVY